MVNWDPSINGSKYFTTNMIREKLAAYMKCHSAASVA